MAIKAQLHIDGKIFNILLFNLSFHQGSDVTGKPTQRPVFKEINITIETQKDANFYEWMIAKNLTKNFEIHIMPRILGSRIRKIKFYDAHLVYWKNNFSATNEDPVSETLTITAAGVEDSFSSGVYTAKWRVTFPEDNTTATSIEEEKEFTRSYLTDIEGEEISGYNIGDTIVLCLETRNRIGDKITVNLNDPEYDFEHNGVHLTNDTLKNHIISEDLERVELKVIQQKNS